MLKKLGFRGCSTNKLESRTTGVEFIENRIKISDKYVPDLKKAIINYTEKTAKTRDSIDKVHLLLSDFSDAENVTIGLKKCLKDLSDVLLDIGTIKDSKVKTMEDKVIEQLSDFDKLCNHVRHELKTYKTTSEKEKSRMKILTRMKLNHSENLEEISLAEEEYSKAKRESAKAFKSLEELIDLFENKKLNSTKAALVEWILVELRFHAKALDLYTKAYGIVADMDVNSDIEEFRTIFRLRNDSTTSECRRSSSALHLPPTFRRKTKINKTPSLVSNSNSSRPPSHGDDSVE